MSTRPLNDTETRVKLADAQRLDDIAASLYDVADDMVQASRRMEFDVYPFVPLIQKIREDARDLGETADRLRELREVRR